MYNLVMRQFSIILLSILTTPSFSCTCWNDSFPLTYLDQNDTLPSSQQHYIIKGIVIDNQIGSNVYNRWGHGNLVNVKVLEYWPKEAIMNDTVTIINDEMTCASGFKLDSIYLIGAYNTHRYLATSSCEGTGLFSKFENLIDSLGTGGIPQSSISNNKRLKTNRSEESQTAGTYWKFSIIISMAASAIFAIVVFLVRWLYFKYWLFRKAVGKYFRFYEGDNQELKDQVSAMATVKSSAMNELTVTVTTFIKNDLEVISKEFYSTQNRK